MWCGLASSYRRTAGRVDAGHHSPRRRPARPRTTSDAMSSDNPPSSLRLLAKIEACPHDAKYSDIPKDLHDALQIALHRQLIETDAVKHDGGPVLAVAFGSAEAAARIAAYEASRNPTYWLTS